MRKTRHGIDKIISAGSVVLVAFLLSSTALALQGEAGARKVDVVMFRGHEVPALLGTPLDRIGGYAFRGGNLEPIPFQIDERGEDGHLIYTTYSGGTTAKSDGVLGDRDEILFAAKDAGEKWTGDSPPKGAVRGEEVTVSDPLGGPDSWFYLFTFDGKAPRSDVDYVSYDHEKDWITARYYAVGFPYRKAMQVPSYFSISEKAGGDGTNIYDLYKIKMYLDLRFIGKITKTQNDFITKPVGYIDGPIRVCRRVASALRLAGPIRSAMVYSDTHYYPHYCVFPARLQIPFKLKYIAWDVSVRVSDDYSPGAKGMVWYNDRNPGGITLTGKPSPAGEELDRRSYRWKLVTGPQGTMMSVFNFDPALEGMGTKLYFCDDELKADEPCQFLGQIGNSGYEFTDLRSIPRGSYKMAGYIFCLVDYEKGEEEFYINSIERPLTVSARPIAAAQK